MANLRQLTMKHAGLGYTPKYCPNCLDLWATPTRWPNDVSKRIPRPPIPHEACRKALEVLSES